MGFSSLDNMCKEYDIPVSSPYGKISECVLIIRSSGYSTAHTVYLQGYNTGTLAYYSLINIKEQHNECI